MADQVTPIEVPKDAAKALKYKRIYIAGPISLPKDAACPEVTLEKYLTTATEAYFELVKKGWNPFCPHFAAHYGMKLKWFAKYEIILPRDFEWLSICDAILLLPGWENSFGSRLEYTAAKRWGLTIYERLSEVPNF